MGIRKEGRMNVERTFTYAPQFEHIYKEYFDILHAHYVPYMVDYRYKDKGLRRGRIYVLVITALFPTISQATYSPDHQRTDDEIVLMAVAKQLLDYDI